MKKTLMVSLPSPPPPCHIYYAYNIPALAATDRKAKRYLLSCIHQQPNGPPEMLSAYRLTYSFCLHTPHSLTFSSSSTSRGQQSTSPEPICFSQRPRDTKGNKSHPVGIWSIKRQRQEKEEQTEFQPRPRM